MTTIGTTSRPAYVYDADTDTWVPIGVGPHTHDEYIDKTIINAKGDIVVGTAADAVARLGVGPEGSVLIADPTSPTGLAWGEAGGSITVSTTAPEEPGEGDLWFNSTNATTYIYYDGFWVEQSPAIAGPKGEPGVVASDSEPSDTDVLWLDTDEESDVPVPAGGTTGQVLIKSSSDNYDTDWVNPPSGNAIINGAFDIWQRGTTATLGVGLLVADRWKHDFVTAVQTGTASRQSFTSGELDSLGVTNNQFYQRIVCTNNNGSTQHVFFQNIEDVTTFANTTVTISFYAKAAASATLKTRIAQLFGSGGSSPVTTTFVDHSLTTSWQRFTVTVPVPSITGKTIGAGSSLRLDFSLPLTTYTIDIWGVQVEAGPVATPFRRNANSLQGELAACQRYYFRTTNVPSVNFHNLGFANTSTSAYFPTIFPVQMRIAPAALEQSGTAGDYSVRAHTSNNITCTAVPTFLTSNSMQGIATFTVASGLTAGHAAYQRSSNANGFLGWSAEL